MKKHNNKFTVTEHKVYFTPFINATSPKTGGAKLRLSLSSVSLIVTERGKKGRREGSAAPSLGQFEISSRLEWRLDRREDKGKDEKVDEGAWEGWRKAVGC